MLDILLYIPRLLWGLIKLIWGVLSEVLYMVLEFLKELVPMTQNFWAYLGFAIVWFGMAFVLRKEWGGFFAALFKLLGCLLGGLLLYALSPIGLVLTIIYAILVGGGLVQDRPWMSTVFGLAWVVLVAIRIVG